LEGGHLNTKVKINQLKTNNWNKNIMRLLKAHMNLRKVTNLELGKG
jgi:hypothetical protein